MKHHTNLMSVPVANIVLVGTEREISGGTYKNVPCGVLFAIKPNAQLPSYYPLCKT
jgi:hypothetical protein